MSKKNRQNWQQRQQGQGGPQNPPQTPAPQGAAKTGAAAGANPPSTTPPPAGQTAATANQTPTQPIAEKKFTQAEADAIMAKLQTDDYVPPLDIPTEPPPDKPNDPVTNGCKALAKPTYTVVMSGSETTVEAIICIIVTLLAVFTTCLFILTGIGMGWAAIGQAEWMIPIAILTTALFAIQTYEYVIVREDTQKALVFNDSMSKERLVVYMGGKFALRPWYFSPYKSVPGVDLQTDKLETDEFETVTKNGVRFLVKLQFTWKPVMGSIIQYLGFAPTVIPSQIKAVLKDRINRLAALNEWESLANNRGAFMDSISIVFGKANEQTPFEEHLGIIVSSNPKILEFAPSGEESIDLANALPRMRMLAKEVRILKAGNPTITSEDALKKALLILETKGFIDKNVSIVASPNIRTVFMDDDRRTL